MLLFCFLVIIFVCLYNTHNSNNNKKHNSPNTTVGFVVKQPQQTSLLLSGGCKAVLEERPLKGRFDFILVLSEII